MPDCAPCTPCARGFHDECIVLNNGCLECHPEGLKNESLPLIALSETDSPKARKELKDPESTGRKRAAVLYPIEPDASCEWRNQRNCGGGLRPIIGCYDGNQQHRHHGPVKNTTRNELGNVHRICSPCHHHWHELNDLVYDESQYNLLPHQPLTAETQDVIQNVLDWKSGKMGEQFVLASTQNRAKGMAKNAIITD